MICAQKKEAWFKTKQSGQALTKQSAVVLPPPPSPRGGGLLGSSFAGYVPLASQSSYPIVVYSVARYRPHLSHFWANINVISKTEFNAGRLLNIKTTAGTIFQPRIFLF